VWGSYEAYVRVVGGIIGAAAPNWTTWQANRDALIAESDEDDPIKQLLGAWWQNGNRTLTVSSAKGASLSSIIMEKEIDLEGVRLRTPGTYDYNTASLGQFIKQQLERVFDISAFVSEPCSVEVVKAGKSKTGMRYTIKRTDVEQVDGIDGETVVPLQGRRESPTETADAVKPNAVTQKPATARRVGGWTHPETGKTYYRGDARRMRKEYEKAQVG